VEIIIGKGAGGERRTHASIAQVVRC